MDGLTVRQLIEALGALDGDIPVRASYDAGCAYGSIVGVECKLTYDDFGGEQRDRAVLEVY